MLSHIITKMVLDRTCPVCQGLKQYKKTESATTKCVECKNCSGTGFMADTEPAVLVVGELSEVPTGIAVSMETQKMYVVDSTNVDRFLAMELKRIYAYNIAYDSLTLKALVARGPKEIHMYLS
jgi:hypothetical protein